MSETAQHTPGPWEIELEYDNTLGGYRIRSEYGASALPCNPALAVGRDQKSAMANARLIAAAPDLLSAAQFVVNDTPKPGEDARLTVEGYNRLCAAIALARPQQEIQR